MAVPHGVGSVWAQAAWEVYWKLVDRSGLRPQPLQRRGQRGQPARDAVRERRAEEHRLQPDLHAGSRRHHPGGGGQLTAARTSAASGRPSRASAWAPTRSAAAPTARRRPTASTSPLHARAAAARPSSRTISKPTGDGRPMPAAATRRPRAHGRAVIRKPPIRAVPSSSARRPAASTACLPDCKPVRRPERTTSMAA